MGIIYKIVNKQTTKFYIGQTKRTLAARWKTHLIQLNNSTKPLYNSIRKHGIENFYIEEIEQVDNHLLDNREKFWIKLYNTTVPNGYNLSSGGGGGFVISNWSLEERQKLYKQQGESRKGQKRTDAQRQNISNGAKKREHSKTHDQKKAISEKISTTLKTKGCRPPKTVLYGKDNSNYVDVDLNQVFRLIKERKTLKHIARYFNTTTVTIWNKLKSTGKTYKEWKNEFSEN